MSAMHTFAAGTAKGAFKVIEHSSNSVLIAGTYTACALGAPSRAWAGPCSRIFAFLLLPALVGGCTIVQAGKLIAPQHFGLTQIGSSLYVEVAISEAPEHSEAHWQGLIASNASRPTPEELRTFKTLKEWLAAVRKYGDDESIERKARGTPKMRPVYAAAGHELRPWLAAAGTQGLLTLIARLNKGEDFESVYQMASHPSTPRAASGSR
jgi:hypothetical protein